MPGPRFLRLPVRRRDRATARVQTLLRSLRVPYCAECGAGEALVTLRFTAVGEKPLALISAKSWVPACSHEAAAWDELVRVSGRPRPDALRGRSM
jgi:hypothetical protein